MCISHIYIYIYTYVYRLPGGRQVIAVFGGRNKNPGHRRKDWGEGAYPSGG